MSPSRRHVLAGWVGLGGLALAGCLDRIGSGSESELLEASSIETVGTECAGADAETASADRAGETLSLSGVLPASNPCHEAVLVDVSLGDGTLSVRVDVESTLEEGGVCVECVGAVTYEATVDLPADATVRRVVVDHETGETIEISL